MTLHGKRRERLLSLAAGYDAVLVNDPKNLFYLTDFWGGGIGLVKRDGVTLFTSVMEQQRALETGKDTEVVALMGAKAIYAEVKRQAKGKVLLDAYDQRLRGKVDGDIFLQTRRKKDPEELGRIVEASRRIEKLYRLLEAVMRPGRTELEIAAEVMKLSTEEGLSPLAAEGSLSPIIIASGPNSSFPHAELTERRVKEGDMVVADIFYRYQGYCSDCTRTYAIGRPPRETREAYQTVLDAQRRGIELVRKGTVAKEVHAGVNGVLAERGLDKYFTHGTGHGVGIDIHENPSIGRVSEDVLADGDVVTVEPGVYVAGKYGIRIEDTLSVNQGTANLYTYTRELLEL